MTLLRTLSRSAAVVALAAGLVGLPTTGTPAVAATDCGQRTKVELLPDPSYPIVQYGARTLLWPRGYTGKGVTVAVLDSGINDANPHFTKPGTIVGGATMLPEGPTTADYRHPQARLDRTEHGTSVAGLIAARPLQGSGVVGLAPEATILPVQVYAIAASDDPKDAALTPKTAQIAAGIRYAADAGAKVIVLSMSQDSPDPDLEAAVAQARAKGSLLVASAGDRLTTANKTDSKRYPAAYPGVLSVTAVTQAGLASPASIHGPHVGVAAPGERLPTTYGRFGDCVVGEQPATSYATPLVGAVAAMLAQRYPAEGPDLWKYRIEASATRPVSSQRDDRLGWGVLAPYDAVTMTLDPNRPGPPMPGQAAPLTPLDPSTVRPMEPPTDAYERARQVGGWVVLAALAVTLGLWLVRGLREGTLRAGRDHRDDRLSDADG